MCLNISLLAGLDIQLINRYRPQAEILGPYYLHKKPL